MFNLFNTKPKLEILQDKYNKLMEQAFQLEQTNITAAANKRRKAQSVLMQIVELEKSVSTA